MPPEAAKVHQNWRRQIRRITRHYTAKLQTAFTASKQLNLLTVTFPVILKWTEINLRWLIVDGLGKKGKGLTITGNIQEPWRYHSFLIAFFFCPFTTLKFVDVWAKHQSIFFGNRRESLENDREL